MPVGGKRPQRRGGGGTRSRAGGVALVLVVTSAHDVGVVQAGLYRMVVVTVGKGIVGVVACDVRHRPDHRKVATEEVGGR